MESLAWATLKSSQGSNRRALTQVDRSLQTMGAYAREFQLLKVSLLSNLKKWDLVIRELDALRKLHPTDARVFYKIAIILMIHGNWRDSLAVIKKAERYLPSEDDEMFLDLMYDTKIYCLSALGKTEEAFRFAKKIAKKHPRFENVQESLALMNDGLYAVQKPWGSMSKKQLTKLKRL